MTTQQHSDYPRFLEVANEAHKVATPEQRQALRALTTLHLKPEQMTPEIEKIMGW